jgi:hypothetical protein
VAVLDYAQDRDLRAWSPFAKAGAARDLADHDNSSSAGHALLRSGGVGASICWRGSLSGRE